MESSRNQALYAKLHDLYAQYEQELLFHGWHHVTFVTRKALEFADEFPGIDHELLEAAAMLHDVNYIVDTTSMVDVGAKMREDLLRAVGYTDDEIKLVEVTVHDASTEFSGGAISDMSKALSDGDKLFKVLPLGPMILSSRYIAETKTDLRKWAERIIREQKPLLESDKYFHTQRAKQKYLVWARLNLEWVELVHASLDDDDIKLFIRDCHELGYL